MKPYDLPDARGHFGPYGGIFVAETLVHALEELRVTYERYRDDPEFVADIEALANEVDAVLAGIEDEHQRCVRWDEPAEP